jgi:hypothetical protein
VRLPSRITLPSGTRVVLGEKRAAGEPRKRRAGAPLFSETLEALAENVTVEKIDIDALPLADFHVLRAVLTKAGYVAEESIDVTCANCGAPLTITPCAGLEIGPWVDGELGDEELDSTLPFGEAHEIPAIAMGRVRTAKSVTFAPRTVAEAKPFFTALGASRLEIDGDVVTAMGVVALGPETDPARIAEALATCDDAAFDAVSEIYLASHYPPRLGCIAFCKECGARNDVDAPYDRELEPARAIAHARERTSGTEMVPFPDFEAFAERAEEIAEPMLAEIPGERVDVIVDEGTPAVDEGGEPLLGSYLPREAGEGGRVAHAPLVTVYYRTFRAMWDEDGPYDWQDELTETIEHELEHHVYFLRGDDPMDAQERAQIREEALRIVGRRETTRRAAESFASSIRDFVARTWIIWLLALVALAVAIASSR